MTSIVPTLGPPWTVVGRAVARLRTRLRQLLRYGTVSIVSTLTSLSVLGLLVVTGAAPATVANLIATGIGTVPSYELNRRWVWGNKGARRMAEVVPFVALTAAGLVLSTLLVAVADRWARSSGSGTTTRTLAVELANVVGFGSVWIAQFVILDRFLFGRRALDGTGRPADEGIAA